MSKFIDYLKTKQAYINLGIAVGALIVVTLIAFLCLGVYTRHGSGIEVPQLNGMPIEKATALLDDQGFRYQIDSNYVLDKPSGTVIQQDPDAGTIVKENRTIYLTIVTRLAPNIVMPDIEQKPYREVVSILSNHGLKMGDTTYKHDIARDLVLEAKFGNMVILAGSKIPKGSKIDLVLGDGAGASEVAIPDVVNQDFDAAKFVITNSGLVLGNISYEGAVTDSNKLIVKSQFPPRIDSTSKASIGTHVNLVVTQKN